MYREQLSKINKARNGLYQLDFISIVLIAAVLISGGLMPIMAPLFGLLLFALLYHKLIRVARMPCPRCRKPFGTNSKVVIGFGTEECESCELPLRSE